MSDKIKRAELLARFVHLGQKRQDGEDYIHHCERIVYNIKTEYCRKQHSITGMSCGNCKSFPICHDNIEDIICAAWLHDTLEDAGDKQKRLAVFDMIRWFFPDRIHGLVMVLTHDDFQTYNQYIELVSRFPEALQIKWADMIDNTSYKVPEKQWNKYKDACLHLQSKGIEIPTILKERFKI